MLEFAFAFRPQTVGSHESCDAFPADSDILADQLPGDSGSAVSTLLVGEDFPYGVAQFQVTTCMVALRLLLPIVK